MTPSFLARIFGRSPAVQPPDNRPRLEVELGPAGVVVAARNAPGDWLDRLDAWPAEEHGRLLVLRQLVEQEVAGCTPSGLEIPYRPLRELPDEDLIRLSEAEVWPYQVRLEEVGTFNLPTFACCARFLDELDRDVPGLTRRGCFFEQAGRRWLLSKDLYDLLEALEAPPEGNSFEDNLERFAILRPMALRAGARLSPYLQSEEVLAPSRLDVELVVDPAGALQVRLVAGGLVDGRELREKLDSGPVLPRVLTFQRPGLDRIRMVARGPVHQALKEARPLGHLQGARKHDFLDRPERYLSSPAVDLEQFSDRVREAGIRRYRVSPRRTAEGAFELQFESETGKEATRLPAEASALEALRRQVASGLEAGHLSFELAGRLVRLEPSLVEELEVVSRPRPPAARPAPEPAPRAPAAPAPNIVREPPAPSPESFDTAPPAATNPPPPLEAPPAAKEMVPPPDEVPPLPKPTPLHAEEALRLPVEAPRLLEETPLLPKETPRIGGVPCEPAVLPRSLSPHVELLLHQLHGLAWLQTLVRNELARGALLADDMGLGKTLQVWAFLEWYRERHPEHGPILVVVPVTLLDNWQDEYRKFFRGPGHLDDRQICRLHGPGLEALRTREGLDVPRLRELPVVLTGYAAVRNHYEILGKVPWSVIVADETQTIKNPAAATTRALKHLSARFRVAMTGTPVENGLADLWSIMDFAVRGHLGGQKEFLDAHTPGSEAEYASLAGRIAAKASPSLLRRRKQDYLDGLPERNLHFVPLAMTERQQQDYLRVVSEYRRTAREGRKGLMDLLIRLRQVCCAAEGLEPGHPTQVAEEASCKVRWLLARLREIRERGEKALVFVEYRDLQRLLVALLEREFGIPVGMINGDVEASGSAGSESPRRQILRRFATTEGFSVLVLSPLAAGVGLTIVEANHVIHFTRHWNPAREDQATDRVYRIGQQRPVHVYHPLAIGAGFKSLDERLHEMLESKRKLQDSALFPVASREVDVEKLTEILDLPEDPFGPIGWEEVQDMDGATFRRFVCALHGRMGWQVTRLGGDPLDARGHRGGEVLALRCVEPGEECPDLPEGTVRVFRHPWPDAPTTALGPDRLRELLERHRPTWNDLLAYLPPEETLRERLEAPPPPERERSPASLAIVSPGPAQCEEIPESLVPLTPKPTGESPARLQDVTPVPVLPLECTLEHPSWVEHLPAALRLGKDLPNTRDWLSKQLASVPEAAGRLPDVHRLLRLTSETLAAETGRDPDSIFRARLLGEADSALLPDGRLWRLFLRQGLAPEEEVRLYVHALAHRLLGHLREGDTLGHWDRLDGLERRRWDREAEALLGGRMTYPAPEELG